MVELLNTEKKTLIMSEHVYREILDPVPGSTESPPVTSWEDEEIGRKHLFIISHDTVAYMVRALRKSPPTAKKPWSRWEDLSVVRFSMKPTKSGERRLNVYSRRRKSTGGWLAFHNTTNYIADLKTYIPDSHLITVFSEVNTMLERVTGAPVEPSFEKACELEKANTDSKAVGKAVHQWATHVAYPMWPGPIKVDPSTSFLGAHEEFLAKHVSGVVTDLYRSRTPEEYTKKIVGVKSYSERVVPAVIALPPETASFLRIFKAVLTPDLLDEFLSTASSKNFLSTSGDSYGSPYVGKYEYLSYFRKIVYFASKETKVMILKEYQHSTTTKLPNLSFKIQRIPAKVLKKMENSVEGSSWVQFIERIVDKVNAKSTLEQHEENFLKNVEVFAKYPLGGGFVITNTAIKVDSRFTKSEDIWSYSKYQQYVCGAFSLPVDGFPKTNFVLTAAKESFPYSRGSVSSEFLQPEHFEMFISKMHTKVVRLLTANRVARTNENMGTLTAVMLVLNLGLGGSLQYRAIPSRVYAFIRKGYTVDQIVLLLQTKLIGEEAEEAIQMPESWFTKMFDIRLAALDNNGILDF